MHVNTFAYINDNLSNIFNIKLNMVFMKGRIIIGTLRVTITNQNEQLLF